jgi:exosome complex component RRP41
MATTLSTARPSRHEFLSPEGLRADGRRQGEIRRLACSLDTTDSSADGSAFIAQGNTHVTAYVHGPQDPSGAARKLAVQERASLVCESSMTPFAMGEWNPRSRGDRMLAELGVMVESVFEPLVLTHLYPGSQIVIQLRISQVDGGLRCACINAVSLALIDAGIAMRDYACACSVGHVQGTLLLDLSAVEDGAGAELSVAYLPKIQRVALTHLSAVIPASELDGMLELAIGGCRQIFDALDGHVREHMRMLAGGHGSSGGGGGLVGA